MAPDRHVSTPPAGTLHRASVARHKKLGTFPLEYLIGELLVRGDEFFAANDANTHLGNLLQDRLSKVLDIHGNRFSRRRYADRFDNVFGAISGHVKGGTVLDLGCGALNPGGFLFLLLMLGARRGIAVDLEAIEDESRAVRALAQCAEYVLIDPESILGSHPITREEILRNIASFDLRKLRLGDPSGVDEDRLCYRRESVCDLSAATDEVDVTLSTAFLEHVPDVDEALDEIARVTRPGGLGVHTIDCTDHRRYRNSDVHPLAFLEEESDEPIVHFSNRMRPSGFRAAFEAHGFDMVSEVPLFTVDLTEKHRSRFASRFRAMPLDELAVGIVKMTVCRRS